MSGLNHVAHSENYDNGYEKDENGGYRQINNDGGDMFDILYGENGQMLEITEVQIFKGQTLFGSGMGGNSARGYGKRFVQESPSLYDSSWDIFRAYVEFKTGFFLSRVGTTFLSKSARGLAVGLGGSSRTLKSSYLFKYKWGFNVDMGIQLPTLYGRTGNLGVFLGRNSPLMGVGLVSDGMFHWSDKIYNNLFY